MIADRHPGEGRDPSLSKSDLTKNAGRLSELGNDERTKKWAPAFAGVGWKFDARNP
jgi:hypothetical protein